MSKTADFPPGAYSGQAFVTLLDDGRRVRLTQDFGYLDQAGVEWNVPAGAIVDGASIPQPLWSLIGGPFEGKYRAASIIHDWYCDVRTRRWKPVHRMFHQAMLTSGVDVRKAWLMYAGVYWGGPRWSDSVVENSQLLARLYVETPERALRGFHMKVESGPIMKSLSTAPYMYDLTQGNLEEIAAFLDECEPTLEDIEAFVDCRIRDLDPLRV